jgi:hypothetical protein
VVPHGFNRPADKPITAKERIRDPLAMAMMQEPSGA